MSNNGGGGWFQNHPVRRFFGGQQEQEEPRRRRARPAQAENNGSLLPDLQVPEGLQFPDTAGLSESVQDFLSNLGSAMSGAENGDDSPSRLQQARWSREAQARCSREAQAIWQTQVVDIPTVTVHDFLANGGDALAEQFSCADNNTPPDPSFLSCPCPICLDDIYVGCSSDDDSHSVVRLPCGHLFHGTECLRPWIDRAAYNWELTEQQPPSCPVCRWDLSLGSSSSTAPSTNDLASSPLRPRYARFELEQRLTIRQLLFLLDGQHAYGVVDKMELVQLVLDSGRIEVLSQLHWPVSMTRQELEALSIRALLDLLGDASYRRRAALEKSDLIRLCLERGRVRLKEEDENKDETKPAASSTSPVATTAPSTTTTTSSWMEPTDIHTEPVSKKKPRRVVQSVETTTTFYSGNEILVETVLSDDEDDDELVPPIESTDVPDDTLDQNEDTTNDNTMDDSPVAAAAPPGIDDADNIEAEEPANDGQSFSTTPAMDFESDGAATATATESTLPPEMDGDGDSVMMDASLVDHSNDEQESPPSLARENDAVTNDRSLHSADAASSDSDHQEGVSFVESNNGTFDPSQVSDVTVVALCRFLDDCTFSVLLALATVVDIDLSRCGSDHADMMDTLRRSLLQQPAAVRYLQALVPLTCLSVPQLRANARAWQVDVSDCLEKGDILLRLIQHHEQVASSSASLPGASSSPQRQAPPLY